MNEILNNMNTHAPVHPFTLNTASNSSQCDSALDGTVSILLKGGEDQYSMTNAHLNTSLKKSKGNAKKPRRDKEEENRLAVQELKKKNLAQEMFQETLRKMTMLSHDREMSNRLKIVSNYASVFQRGFKNQAEQWDFLNVVFHKDCLLNHDGFPGPESVIRQWKLYTTLHKNLKYTLNSIRLLGDKNIVAMNATMDLIVDRNTIEALYPHLLQDEELVQRCIGKRLKLNCEKHFYFENGKIAFLQADIDFIRKWTPILDNNPILAAKVFNQSRLKNVLIGNDVEKFFEKQVDSKIAAANPQSKMN